jgi:hypothetical protein
MTLVWMIRWASFWRLCRYIQIFSSRAKHERPQSFVPSRRVSNQNRLFHGFRYVRTSTEPTYVLQRVGWTKDRDCLTSFFTSVVYPTSVANRCCAPPLSINLAPIFTSHFSLRWRRLVRTQNTHTFCALVHSFCRKYSKSLGAQSTSSSRADQPVVCHSLDDARVI